MDHYGYMGKFLRGNLESGKITVDEPDESYYKHYLASPYLFPNRFNLPSQAYGFRTFTPVSLNQETLADKII